MHRIQIIILQMDLVHLENRHHVHFPPGEQPHPMRPRQGRLNATLLEMPSHQFAMNGDRLILVQIPDHEAP